MSESCACTFTVTSRSSCLPQAGCTWPYEPSPKIVDVRLFPINTNLSSGTCRPMVLRTEKMANIVVRADSSWQVATLVLTPSHDRTQGETPHKPIDAPSNLSGMFNYCFLFIFRLWLGHDRISVCMVQSFRTRHTTQSFRTRHAEKPRRVHLLTLH